MIDKAWRGEGRTLDIMSDNRDMGSQPPRQTEIRMKLKGDYATQVRIALDAYSSFGFPSILPAVREVIEVGHFFPLTSFSLSLIPLFHSSLSMPCKHADISELILFS
jgi:hypothetical protein